MNEELEEQVGAEEARGEKGQGEKGQGEGIGEKWQRDPLCNGPHWMIRIGHLWARIDDQAR